MESREQIRKAVRAIGNDPDGRMFPDDRLEPFILEAEKRVPMLGEQP